MSAAPHGTERVAVTGVYLASGLGTGTEEVWRAVQDGDSALDRCQDLTGVFAARLPGVASAESLIERAGRGALRHAALRPDTFDPYEIGVALGTNSGPESLWTHYLAAGAGRGPLPHPAHTCADRLTATLGSRGPKAVFATGCIASANAVGYAYDAVATGRATVMLAGGYEALNVTTVATFASWKSIDPAPCAPYVRSGGLSLGEAVAFLVLESERCAHARGARVHAYLLGYGLTSDSHHITAPPPDGSGLRGAMLGALGRAGLTPDAIDYVNGHGTGTPANDTAELNAMRAVFAGPHAPPMSSSKAQVGHTLGACGAVEAVLTTLALRDQVLPPTANAGDGAPWDVVPRTARPAEIGTALSNSIAFGGACCSLVLGRADQGAADRQETDLWITGAGVVSPLALGRRAFLTALREGRTRTAREGPDAAGLGAFIDARYRPRLDGLGTLTVAAARMAWDDAGLEDGTRVGIVLATAAGPIETIERLNETVEREGPEYVSAVHAPNVVTSVPAGYATLDLGLGGPLAAVSTGDASGLIALGHAADLIRQGQADAVLVVAADQVTGTMTRALRRYGLHGPGAPRPYARSAAPGPVAPGSCAVVLEASDHARARRATALGCLLGHAVTSGPGASDAELSDEAWAHALRGALEESAAFGAEGPAGCAVDVYGAARGVAAVDNAELAAIGACLDPARTRLAAITGATGHCQAAGPLLSVVAALDGCRDDRPPALPPPYELLPAARSYRGGCPADGPRRGLVTAASWGGTYAAAVVGPPPGES